MNKTLEWLRTNWAILAFMAAAITAWADQQNEVRNLKEAVGQQAATNKKLEEVREQSIRQDEKLKSIERSQQTAEQLLRDLLQGQRDISRKVSK